MNDESPDLDDPYQALADALAVPVDAVLFVVDALEIAPEYAGDEAGDAMAMDTRHCSALELCNAVKLYAADMWQDDAPQTLAGLGIRCSEDLGRIVFGLVDAGLMIISDEDKRSDFNDLCRFDGFV